MPKPVYNEDAIRDEELALDAVLEAFKVKMKTELLDKLSKGYTGWDDASFGTYMKEQLKNHAAKGDYVKAANLAMFLEKLNI
jgi:hypothetical protein